MSTMTRGPHAPAVYWRRRLVVALVALFLVLGAARLLGLGGDDRHGCDGDCRFEIF